MKYKLALVSAIILSACGTKDVSFNTLEEAKQTARENSLFNAQRFRQENPTVADWSIVPNGDSSQENSCPQGDGWATLTFVGPDRASQKKVKCSTVSGATGCLFDSEFKGKSYASDDGHCQPVTKVPFPIKKIQN